MPYPKTEIDVEAYPAAPWLLRHGLPYDTDVQVEGLLLPYALDRDPFGPLWSGLLPAVDPISGRLRLDFHASRPGITYRVETSADLQTWTADGVTLSELEEDGRRTASLAHGGVSQFMRLVVEIE